MVEFWVWAIEPKGEQRAFFRKGDIIKIHPPNWHKYFDVDFNKLTIRVKKMKWDHAIKRTFTEPLRDEDGKIVARRRYYIDLDTIKKKPNANNVIKLRTINKLLRDKLK